MTDVLGIDLGTTFSAAAVWADGRAEIVPLGNRSAAMPSVVLLRADGEILTGEAAERRAQSEPGNTAREFKRRLGDPVPLLLGGTPYGVETLTAHLLRAVVAQVVEQRGERPDRIVLCHPASYGAFKLDLLAQAARIAEVGEVSFVSEPEAAAVHYASQERVPSGEHIAVYDFGGGTFDAAVLRKTDDGFELLGSPEGLERLGGIDFDQAVFAHVAQALGGALDGLDPDDVGVINALAHLRDKCRDAKEALSVDTDVQIPVLLPNVQTEVRLTRAEFESLLRPRISETVSALQRAIRSAGLADADVSRILLVGGSSRIPLVGQLVREGTGRPTALDAHPKHAIALGAALDRSADVASAPATADMPVDASSGQATDVLVTPLSSPAAAAPTDVGAPRLTASSPRRRLVVGAAVTAVLIVGGAAFALSGRGDDTPAAEISSSSSLTTAPATTTTSTTTAVESSGQGGGVIGGLSGRLVSIDAARVEGGHYVIDFSTAGFEPSDSADGYRARFYFVRSSDMAALVNGASTAEVFEDYAGVSPFEGLDVADRPDDADQICGAVVDSDGRASNLSGNCVPIPA